MNKPVNCGCGGEAIVDQTDGYDEYQVYCSKCFMSSGTFNTEAEAITAWNRAMGERTVKVKNITHVRGYPPEGECSNCGFYVDDDGEYCPGCGARLEWE